MLTVPFPSVPVRLSAAQIELIRPGLNMIVGRHRTAVRTGDCHYAIRGYLHPRRRYGQFHCLLMDQVCALWSKLPTDTTRRCRLHLHAFELAACILALRVAVRQVRHGHLHPRGADPQQAGRRLLRTLEGHRKRGKRAFIRDRGWAAFNEASAHWGQLVLWLRVHLLPCGCRHFKYPGDRYYKAMMRHCLAHAKQGLEKRKETCPPDELRYSVRLAVRYIRRGRTEFGLASLLRDPDFAAEYLADFVLCRRARKRRGL